MQPSSMSSQVPCQRVEQTPGILPSSWMLGKVNLLTSREDARHFGMFVDVKSGPCQRVEQRPGNSPSSWISGQVSQLATKFSRVEECWRTLGGQVSQLVNKSSRRMECWRTWGGQPGLSWMVCFVSILASLRRFYQIVSWPQDEWRPVINGLVSGRPASGPWVLIMASWLAPLTSLIIGCASPEPAKQTPAYK